ncbi:Cell cycle-associated protein [Phaffia rhodozyma]|uniref:Cell cycle-associated protein n=1 Tax=Phaffia rhodozyma TaxID=264483 RepID=A0A0F7SMA5_PHARH|nr:Cell cycle-associated protein [Phaffia rhodozyma]
MRIPDGGCEKEGKNTYPNQDPEVYTSQLQMLSVFGHRSSFQPSSAHSPSNRKSLKDLMRSQEQSSTVRQLRLSILKDGQDILDRATLETYLNLALDPSSANDGQPLTQDQYGLLSSIFKRLAVFLRAPPNASVDPIPIALSLFEPSRQLAIGDKVWKALAVSSSAASEEKAKSIAAWGAIQNYESLASFLSSLPSVDTISKNSLLQPLLEKCLSSNQALIAKAPLQILALLLHSCSLQLSASAPDLPTELLDLLPERDLASYRGHLFAVLLFIIFLYYPSDSTSTSNWTWEILVGQVLQILLSPPTETQDTETIRFNILQHTLRPLTQSNPYALLSIAQILLDTHPTHPLKDEVYLSLATLGAGFSLCSPIGQPAQEGKMAVSHDLIQTCLQSSNDTVRLAVLGLVTERPAVNTPLTEAEANVVRLFFKGAMNLWDSRTRQQTLKSTADLLKRIKSSTSATHRDLSKLLAKRARAAKSTELKESIKPELDDEEKVKQLEKDLKTSRELIDWMVYTTITNLRPGSTYPRTILSLKILHLIRSAGFFVEYSNVSSKQSQATNDHPLAVGLFDGGARVTRRILRCFGSTYAEIREAACDLLGSTESPPPGLDTPELIDQLEREAKQTYLFNPRGSDSHTGALGIRLVFHIKANLGGQKEEVSFVEKILDNLEQRVDISVKDIVQAAQKFPVHGLLQALQEIFPRIDQVESSTWQPIFLRTLRLLERVWQTTRRVLSSESVEVEDGVADHEEARAVVVAASAAATDGLEKTNTAGGKGEIKSAILSWAWRAVKESSTLLSILFIRAGRSHTSGKISPIWEECYIVQAAALYRDLLSEIRHPGAFLSIFPAYSELVGVVVKNGFSKLPLGWVYDHLDALKADHRTAGRRSAGLPYGLLAVMLGAPNTVSIAFEALFELGKSDQQPTTVIAAINTLQVVCLNAKLASHLPAYYERAVMTAMDSLASPTWGVRNVGLQLLGSLVKRGFDRRSQAEMTIEHREYFTVWFASYPKLLPLFNRVLVEATQSNEQIVSSGSVFAVLQVFQNLQASEPATKDQLAFVPLIQALSKSKELDIRLAASQALPALIHRSAVADYIISLGLGKERIRSQNQTHGLLLQVLALLENTGCLISFLTTPQVFHSVLDGRENLLSMNPCGPTRAMYIKVVQALETKSSDVPIGYFQEIFNFATLDREHDQEAKKNFPGYDLYRAACARWKDVRKSETSPESTDEHSGKGDNRTDDRRMSFTQRLAAFEGLSNLPDRQVALRHLGANIQIDVTLDEAAQYIALLESSADENESEETRLSTILSLVSASDVLFNPTSCIVSSKVFLALSRLIRGFLQDDDQEIRSLASDLVGRIVLPSSDVSLAQETAWIKWWEFSKQRAAEMVGWRETLWDTVLDERSINSLVEAFQAPFVLFATEPPNRFREAELDITVASAYLSSTAEPLSSYRNKLDRLESAVSRIQSALDTKRCSDQSPCSREGEKQVLLLDPLSESVYLACLRLRKAKEALGSSAEESLREEVERVDVSVDGWFESTII